MSENTKKFLDSKGVEYLWSRLSLEDYPNNEVLIQILDAIDETKADKAELAEAVEGLATKEYVESAYESLKSSRLLEFYCVEDVTVTINGVPTAYPSNSKIQVSFAEDDVFEIIPTSNASILELSAYPGALGTFYPWLEGVKQFSNILFDMNAEDMYTKWSQGNQGSYQVQFAQYVNCIFWSDNPYISDVAKRTNYTLYYTSQLPLCYSTIPENTFKSFYLAFNANTDPNWGNQVYRDSFANATWATQVFSYYGARTIGVFGHDSPGFNIPLPKDCRGLMYQSTAIENAGTFDAENTTNFGAKSGSWRDAFGQCSSLRNLFIKNLKVNLNISWSPINYESISFIIANAANTNKITISVSPYTYNLFKDSDFELAADKNITIELITTNYVEDRRLSSIGDKADKSYVDEKIAELVGSAPDTLNTLEKLATAIKEDEDVVNILNNAITTKADKTYVDDLIANIPTESDVMIVSCPDGSTISHNFEQIMNAINDNKAVYASIYGSIIAPLTYIADDNSFIEFNAINSEITEDQSTTAWVNGLKINSDNSFTVKYTDLLTRHHDEINGPDGEKDIVNTINYLVEKTNQAVLLTEQNLTEEQKAQVKANLGITSGESSDDGPKEVTTEYTYTYDGDVNNGEWVLNGSGHKMYARMGDIPKGTINVVGSQVSVTNATNSSLSVNFEVTEEHLTRELSMYDGAMVAVAQQPGFIQILEPIGYYTDPVSALCICTKPGSYIVSFGGWVEWVTFNKTGIYGYETRTWGGNEYCSSYTFTATSNEEYDNGEFSPVDYKGNEILAFSRGICIGDSVTEGTLDHSEGTMNKAGMSYPALLKRMTGIDIVNAGIAGTTSGTWYDTSLDSSVNWGDWVNNEWFWREPQGTALNYAGYDFAIIHLGINDIGNMGDTPIDTLTTQFETNINKIVTKLRDNNNRIKIFIATIIPSYATNYNENYKKLNEKIREIAEASNDIYLLDLNAYSNLTAHPAYNVWHPTPLGYVKLAEEIKALISYTISENLDDFKDIHLIGTNYIL